MLSRLTKLSEEYNVGVIALSCGISSDSATRSRSCSQTKFNVCFSFAVIHVPYAQLLNEADPGATMTFVAGGALKPIGGHILSHASATRMFLRKGKLYSRHLMLFKLNFSQVELKSGLRSLLTVPTDLRAKPRTSLTKAAGLTSENIHVRSL